MKKILIVDDSSFMRTLIRNIIEKEGLYTILEASTNSEAIEMFKTEEPNIVTLDINISETGGDGINILTDMMNINPESDIIIISAEGYENSRDQCLALGAKDYIKKPFDSKVLLKTLDTYK